MNYNKARFSYDSLQLQRLSYPKLNLNSKLIAISLQTALTIILRSILNIKIII